MPAKSLLLSDAIEEFLQHRKSTGVGKATLRNEGIVLRHLLANVGNILLRNIKERHIDNHFLQREGAVSPSTLNHELSKVRVFFRWAERRRLLGPEGNPVGERRARKVIPRGRLRIPAHEFPRMLDLAPHPTDRITFALGIYLLLRQSEIKGLRVGDVNLPTGEVSVIVYKTAQRDVMPISLELDRELRQWLTEYARRLGRPLRPDDYLVPAKTRPLFVSADGQHMQQEMRLMPDRPLRRPHNTIQRILTLAGYDIRDPHTGKSNGEGVHTLRRSAARAIYDELVGQGYDGAMRTVQSLLHHTDITTTQKYLGLTLDIKRRDELFRAKTMYSAPAESANVVQLSKIGG